MLQKKSINRSIAVDQCRCTTTEEIDSLIEKIGIMPEFVKSSLDEEESSHIDYDDDTNQTLIIVDYPCAEEEENIQKTHCFIQRFLWVLLLKRAISLPFSLYENLSIEDMAKGKSTRYQYRNENPFFLLLMLRISQRFLIYLRQIDFIPEPSIYCTNQCVTKAHSNAWLKSKSLVYFSTFYLKNP